MFTIPVERDGTANRQKGAKLLIIPFGKQRLIEKSPPDHHGFTCQFGIKFVGDPRHGQPAVDTDSAAFRLSGK
ncbi:hypothetical protein D3C79_886510 [compost metagenome]